ncbi:unnamed protein product, partial [Lampetra planeri]
VSALSYETRPPEFDSHSRPPTALAPIVCVGYTVTKVLKLRLNPTATAAAAPPIPPSQK